MIEAGDFSVSSASGMLAHHPKGQLPQLRLAEQPGVGLDRQQQTILAQQGARERVIGADRDGVVVHVGRTGTTSPAPASRARRARTRRSNCPAALRVCAISSASFAAGASVGLVAWLYERGGFVTMLQAFGELCLLVIVAALILPQEIKVPAAATAR